MNDEPYSQDDPGNRHEWGQEPPTPPATWSPYGYATPSDDGRSTLGPGGGGPVLPPDSRPTRSGMRGKGLAATVVAASLLVGG
ncbi:MAG: hypothetical protein J2P22_11865, partial [Nocardioides sp.]|nr:hypothetical protein [Nocardioides sp.]